MPNAPATPEQVTDQFVQNLLSTAGYWRARALAAETECATYQTLYHQAIAVGGPEDWFLLGQVVMEDVPSASSLGGSRLPTSQVIQAAGIFEATMKDRSIPPSGGSGSRSRNTRSEPLRRKQPTTTNAGGTIGDQGALDKRREAMAKARAVRSQRLAAAKAEREGAPAGA